MDFSNETYAVIDSKVLTDTNGIDTRIYNPTIDTVMFVRCNGAWTIERQDKLNIFKLNASLSKIERHRIINISNNEKYFHMIDGMVVFVRSHQLTPVVNVKLMYIDQNDKRVEIETNGEDPKPHFPCNIDLVTCVRI
jgi:hypothetical protein